MPDAYLAADAYSLAQAMIARAKAEGVTAFRLYGSGVELRKLEKLPPEIGQLTDLTSLAVGYNRVEDFSALAGLAGLQDLELEASRIADLAPLAGLSNLRRLDLADTPVADIAPLAMISSLSSLDLTGTRVTDVTALSRLEHLRQIKLVGTPVADLRPLCHLPGLRDPKQRGDGLQILKTLATQLDPKLEELSLVRDEAERTRLILDYLASLGPDWPPVPAAPEQEDLLPVDFDGARFDLRPAHPTSEELGDRIKRKAHDRLRGHASNLALVAGNRFPRLAADARNLCRDLERDFGDLDMLDIHFSLEELRGTYQRRDERRDEDAFTPDVVDTLDKVLMVGPGLTLDNPDVQKLEERRDRYRGQVIDPGLLVAQDALSKSVEADPTLFGERLREIERKVQHGGAGRDDRLRTGQEVVNRNLVIQVGLTVASGMMGGPLSQMGDQVLAWLVSQSDTLTILMPGWGQAMTIWLTPVLMRAREAYLAGRHLLR